VARFCRVDPAQHSATGVEAARSIRPAFCSQTPAAGTRDRGCSEHVEIGSSDLLSETELEALASVGNPEDITEQTLATV
jgi:hypothetical protein